MTRCPNCGFDETGNFCRQCGTSIAQDADSTTMQVRVVCPKCESQGLYELAAHKSLHGLKCSKCQERYTSRVVRVRAKRSRGSKEENKRRFSVRVVDFFGKEDLIEFVNAGYQDFELRARDLAVFSYLKGKLRVVQNLTVRRYIIVSKPECFWATFLYGADSEEVAILRRFRDNVLLDSTLSSKLVSLYYHISPAIVRWMGGNKLLKAISLAFAVHVVRFAGWYSNLSQSKVGGK